MIPLTKLLLPLCSQFYALATLLNGTKARTDFAQMDYKKNEVPGSLNLPQPNGGVAFPEVHGTLDLTPPLPLPNS